MSAQTIRRVYTYIHNYRPPHNQHMPAPHEAYEALGVTKRQYLDALRWLEQHGFVARPTSVKGWRFAKLAVRRCACGAVFTPTNVRLGTARGQVFMRRECGACLRAQETPKRRKRRAAAVFAAVLQRQQQRPADTERLGQ